MPTLNLDFLVVPTYNTLTMGIIDASTYPDNPPDVESPTLEITPPGFQVAIIPFNVDDYNVITSSNLGITEVGNNQPLPDGVYHIKYSIAPAYDNFIEKSIMRIDKIQEKFDSAFMKLDMMECDGAIKKQSKENLSSIYFFIQGAVAAANNCALVQADNLYKQANRMLDNFINSNCGCSGNNY